MSYSTYLIGLLITLILFTSAGVDVYKENNNESVSISILVLICSLLWFISIPLAIVNALIRTLGDK